MKRSLICFLAVVTFAGCVSIKTPETLDKAFPSSGKYEILGSVSCSKKIVVVLGLISVGGITYRDLGVAAEEKFGPVDDVVSVSVDASYDGFFALFFKTITLRGIAIRYTDTAAVSAAVAAPSQAPAAPAADTLPGK